MLNQLDKYVSDSDLLRRLVATTPVTIDPAGVTLVGAGLSAKVFDAIAELSGVVNGNRRLVAMFIQNVGIVPIKYAFDQGDCNANNFHGVLAGGVADDDGLGSVLVVDKFQPIKDLYVYSTSAGGRVTVLKAFAQLG